MTKIPATPFEEMEQQPLHVFTEKAYLDYSMYVILDRALPHIGDGLKPVQRRIIYAMSELGLKATAKFKKSARTVGDVLGKFHPHGDAACYEAMVLMAQHFSYRYPLVDGQGNWGSPDDPKSFAAMRYTESRLSPYAEILLSEVSLGTVNWVPNFDGTLMEPALLPARLPNILLNGGTGIAVGMATDIPPHNLTEVGNACMHLLDKPHASLEEICQYIKGPDYPTEAEIITPQKEIADLYTKGTGSVRMRAVYVMEKEDIVITALPHQVSGAKVLEQIAAQMQAKKLPQIADLRDESDHENPTRLVIIARSNRIDSDALMSHLFASTDLERSYRVNLNMIGIDGRPQIKNILQILKEWLEYRRNTIRRRLQFRLDKILQRLHILEGLLIAYLNIDEVIAIIRFEEKPKAVLMARFNLSDDQAEAILEMKLRHIAKLEEVKIRGEQEELDKERKGIELILSSNQRLNTLLKNEIKHDMDQYGDKRRSPLVERGEAQMIKEEELLPVEPVTIILSQKGWIRAAKGHDIDPTTLSYKAGDEFKTSALGRSNQPAVFLDSEGRSYSLPVHALPSARTQGEPLTGHLAPPSGATFEWVLSGLEDQYYVFASDAGYGFITKLGELYSKNRAGKALIKLPEGSRVVEPSAIADIESQFIAAVTNEGRLLLFPLAGLPILPRGKGNKIIAVSASKVKSREEFMVGIVVVHETQSVILFSGNRKLVLKPSDLVHFHGERGRRGNKLPRGYARVTAIQSA